MGTPVKAPEFAPSCVELRLYVEPVPEAGAAYWRINGFRAHLLIWTVAEWEKLERRPADAQYHPSGVWCALRLGDRDRPRKAAVLHRSQPVLLTVLPYHGARRRA